MKGLLQHILQQPFCAGRMSLSDIPTDFRGREDEIRIFPHCLYIKEYGKIANAIMCIPNTPIFK